MSDFFGGMTTPFLAAFDPDGSKTDQLMGRGRGGGVEDEHPEFQNGACLNHPEGCGLDAGGYYEETILGTHTWHSYNGDDLHGQAAIDKADEVFGGPPTDGITGEKGYYGEWTPTGGQGYSNPVGGSRPGAGR